MVLEVRRGVTILQARVLMNATEVWEAPSALNDGVTLGVNQRYFDQLVKAGFLMARTQGKRTRYAITPAGREFAIYLERLEQVYED